MYKIIIAIMLMASPVLADEIDNLIPAIIQVESNGNPNAVSPAGAIGLMQITPIVLSEWKEWKVIPLRKYGASLEDLQALNKNLGDLIDSHFNVEIGTWYLRRLKDHYLKDKYTVERLLAAYNGGITRLRKNGYDVSKMPKETRDYVKKVMKIYKEVI